MLDLQKLKTFQVVAATSNFTRAAAELGYSQSSITAQIQALERELGAPLFDRVARGVILTEVGRCTLEYASRLIALADEARTVIETIHHGTRGPAVTVDRRVRSDRLTTSCPQRRETVVGRARPKTKKTVDLLLVINHDMFREGLASILEQESDFKLVGQFGSCSDALAALNEIGANMVLLDVDAGQEKALDFVRKCKETGFQGQVLVVTAGASHQEVIQLVQAGAAGILHKHHPTEELCTAIRQVAAERSYSEECITSLGPAVDLTERDKIVLRFVFQGFSNREIATLLDVSVSGVKSSVRQLFDKLGVRTRAQLVKIALEQYPDELQRTASRQLE